METMEDQERRRREEIDQKLLEALDGAPFTSLTPQDWEDIRSDVRARAARRTMN